ncbi:MAG: tripartite tricarboxylate transporter permease [Rhodothermaceae bacterium]|nr:tripartite tricarboxylate transporter permease [Rhodothermaceae bacterium]
MSLFSWEGFVALMLGGLYGSLFGAIPGLTATLAVALFIPIAFFLDPIIALPAIIAISSVAIYAGDVGSSIARIPGTPASAAYAEELYSLSRKKGPVYSLGISAMGSAIGGIIGTLLLIFTATGIAKLAKQFSSFEYFWIAVLGLTAGIFATGRAPIKGFISLLLGILFSTVGVDPTLGYPRFHFENPNLLSGLNYIVAMIGLFGFSEVLEHVYRPVKNENHTIDDQHPTSNAYSFFVAPLLLLFKEKLSVLRSSFLGVVIGFLPGAGADVGSWVATSVQKVGNQNQEDQEDKVIVAGTSSNNAAVASAWIPALSLGLPGDTVTAIVLGVFLMKGITPGPLLFEQSMDLVWSLFITFLIANLVLLPLYGYLTARIASQIIKVPSRILLSIIAGLCVVGAYAINNNPFDIWVMVAMGVCAFALRRGGFPLAQVVLGMVLGPILEQNFMVSAIKSKWSLMSFFERPIALVLMLLTIVIIIVGVRFIQSGKAHKNTTRTS